MRYQKIRVIIWNDEKFINLSQEAKLLFLYLLTSTHSNSIGLYVLPKGYILADLEWTDKQLSKPFAELLDKGFVLYDDRVRLLFIQNHLKHNPLENPNQVKAAIKILKGLPKSPIMTAFKKLLHKPLHKPLLEVLEEGYSEPITITKAITITKEKDIGEAKNASFLSLKGWFDDVMWPSVPSNKKRGKEPTWQAIKKLKPDEATRELIATYFKTYPSVQESYEKAGRFFAEMQDPERVIKNQRFTDPLVPCMENAKGEFLGITYTDWGAYQRAKKEGKENIRFEGKKPNVRTQNEALGS